MPNKTIYVRDERLWLQAKLLADSKGMSMSQLIQKIIADYVERKERELK